jgi:hypothetical protein
MELTPEEMDQIEAYWKGTCSAEDKAQIELRMQIDPEYREEVELFRDLFMVIEKSGDNALKEYLDQVRVQSEKNERTKPDSDNPVSLPPDNPTLSAIPPKNRLRYLWFFAAAAIIIGGALLVWFWQQRQEAKLDGQFYASLNEVYLQTPKKIFSLPAKGQGYVPKDVEYDSLLQRIDIAFKTDNVGEVLRLGLVFKKKYPQQEEFFVDYPLANAYYAKGNWTESIRLLRVIANNPNNIRSQQGKWLLILAQGHTTEYRKEAKQGLEAIVADPLHPRHLEAKQLDQIWRD